MPSFASVRVAVAMTLLPSYTFTSPTGVIPNWPSTSTVILTVPFDVVNSLSSRPVVLLSPFAMAFAADVATPVPKPSLVAVTVTVMSAPASAATSLYVDAVAPSIGDAVAVPLVRERHVVDRPGAAGRGQRLADPAPAR